MSLPAIYNNNAFYISSFKRNNVQKSTLMSKNESVVVDKRSGWKIKSKTNYPNSIEERNKSHDTPTTVAMVQSENSHSSSSSAYIQRSLQSFRDRLGSLVTFVNEESKTQQGFGVMGQDSKPQYSTSLKQRGQEMDEEYNRVIPIRDAKRDAQRSALWEQRMQAAASTESKMDVADSPFASDDEEGEDFEAFFAEQRSLRVQAVDPGEVHALKAILNKGNPNVCRDPHELCIKKFGIDMTIKKMHCLSAGAWLNDEVVNFYCSMLQERHDQKVKEHNEANPETPMRTVHFFNSFFMGKVMENEYTYKNVNRWSKKFNIFEKDKIFIPVNISNTHWTLLVVFMQAKQIHYYDSMSSSGKKYMQTAMRWVKDEGQEKLKMEVDESEWKLVDRFDKSSMLSMHLNNKGALDHVREQVEQSAGQCRYVPQQQNGYDCGMFTCINADFCCDDLPLLNAFSQQHMSTLRHKVGTDILRGNLLY